MDERVIFIFFIDWGNDRGWGKDGSGRELWFGVRGWDGWLRERDGGKEGDKKDIERDFV